MKLKDEHQKLLDKQNELEPVLTIRLMAEILQRGHSYVQALMKKMVDKGLAEEVRTGNGNQYRMVKK